MDIEFLYEIVRQDLKPNPNPKAIATWEGVPITMFTKEELVEIANRLGMMIQNQQRDHARDLDMWFACSRARR